MVAEGNYAVPTHTLCKLRTCKEADWIWQFPPQKIRNRKNLDVGEVHLEKIAPGFGNLEVSGATRTEKRKSFSSEPLPVDYSVSLEKPTVF